MAPGEEAMPSRRGAVLSVVMEPVNGTYGFPTNQHFCPPPPYLLILSTHAPWLHPGILCFNKQSLLWKVNNYALHILTVGVIVELYSYFCILALDRSNVSYYLSFCLRMLVKVTGCMVYWYI